jgi:hypothetical protein
MSLGIVSMPEKNADSQNPGINNAEGGHEGGQVPSTKRSAGTASEGAKHAVGSSRVKVIALWTAGTLALTAVVSECGLRAMGVEFPDFYAMHPVRGWTLRPGAEGMSRNEGSSYVRINSDGMRDREHPLIKPANTYRIAFYGDSFTEALQVDASNTYWAVVERELNGCAGLHGKTVEALNFGVSSYGTSNALLTFDDVGKKYAADANVLGFFVGNDLTDNTQALDHMDHRPYFTLVDGKLVLDTSIAEKPLPIVQRAWHTLLHNSRVAQLAQKLKTDRGARKALAAQQRAASAGAGGAQGVALEDGVYGTPTSKEWQSAWAVTEALLAEFNARSKAQNARFTVAVLSAPVQVEPDPTARVALTAKLGVADLYYPERRLTEAGMGAGYPVVQLAPTLAQAAQSTQTCVHGFGGACIGHWNETGHKIAGSALAKALCAQLTAQP